ncbi:MAG: hypothetical protein K1Y02_05075 [Candidatus Hydrogenedentes bacterium]|nr:hypothetical protein [Candidatus Hydrogenedentota bacterium]
MTTMERQDAAEGERLKHEEFELLSVTREYYIRRGRRALLRHLMLTGQATADVVRDAVSLPPDIDPVLFGAVPNALARAGIIRRIGFAPSTRRQRHGAHMAVWELADHDAAARWLRDFPEPAHPDAAPKADSKESQI